MAHEPVDDPPDSVQKRGKKKKLISGLIRILFSCSYGLEGERMNMEEYGRIGLGPGPPSSTSSSRYVSICFSLEIFSSSRKESGPFSFSNFCEKIPEEGNYKREKSVRVGAHGPHVPTPSGPPRHW